MMKKDFIEKVIRELTVDTEKYRYVYEVSASCAVIKRLPISYLDTTASIDGWEVVEVFE